MNCRKVNSLLSAYIDSELSGVDQLQIRDHLGHCPECAQEHEALLETKRMVARLRVRTPSADLLDRVLQAAHQDDVAYPSFSTMPALHRASSMSRGAMAGIALGMCAAAAIVLMIAHEPQEQTASIKFVPVDVRDVHPLPALPSNAELVANGVMNPILAPPAMRSVARPYDLGVPAIQSVSASARPQMLYAMPDPRLIPFPLNR